MEFIINAKKVHGGCTESMKTLISEKLDFLTKYVDENENVKLNLKNENERFVVKASTVLNDNYHVYMEGSGGDFRSALLDLKYNLFEKCKKHNQTFKSKKIRSSKKKKYEERNNSLPVETGIVKRKVFELIPTTELNAIEEMERLGHDNFVFLNSDENNSYCMLYRKDEGFGLIIFE